MAFELNKGLKLKGATCVVALMACIGLTHTAFSNITTPDDQKAALTIQGQGARPNAKISLSTGPQQMIVTTADQSGQFAFTNLKYASFTDLKFTIDIPATDKGLIENPPSNHLEFSFSPSESIAQMKGQIGKYGTLAFNMAGASDGILTVAGQEGYVDLQTRTMLPMSSGQSFLTASIVNASEICCPKLIVPSPPITLSIMSEAVAAAMPLPMPVNPPYSGGVGVPAATAPVVEPKPQDQTPQPAPPQNTAPANKAKPPVLLFPNKDNGDQNQPNKKPANPYIIQGSVEYQYGVTDDMAAAVNFTQAEYNNTYIGGLKQLADEARNALLMNVAAIGAFIDARNFMDTSRSLQVSAAQSLRKYTTSDQVCRFGTLSKSLASSNANDGKNQLALAKILQDRDLQKMGSLYATPDEGVNAAIVDFRNKHCSEVSNSGFLKGYCDAATNTSDQLYNRDVDFTRVFDVPLTINADFADESKTPEKEAVIALLANLTKIPPVGAKGKTGFDPRDNSKQAQDIRALAAMKGVAANSFAALVSEKTQAKSESSKYMTDMLVQLGLSSDDATKLIGKNPSYFAQMEVMTKKLFQNPAFYANLYESEANVDRQRVAMKALELQQDRDFLESLRRREMLLSVLLNSKLRYDTGRTNTAGTIRK